MAASSTPSDLGLSNGPCSSEKHNQFQFLGKKTTEEEWMKCCFYLMGRNNRLNEEVLLFERMFRERYPDCPLAQLKDSITSNMQDIDMDSCYTQEIKGILSDFDSQKLCPEPFVMEEGNWERLCVHLMDSNRRCLELLNVLKMRLRADGEFKLQIDLDDVPATSPRDGPVLRLISKRLRSLRKKFNRILQVEKTLTSGRELNKDQQVLLQSKPAISAQINLLEELREPLASAVSGEMSLTTSAKNATCQDQEKATKEKESRAHKESKLTKEQWKIRCSKHWKVNVDLQCKLEMLELEYERYNIESYLSPLRRNLAESGVVTNLDTDEDEEDSIFDQQNEEVIDKFYDTEGGVIEDFEGYCKELRNLNRWYKAEVELLEQHLDIFKKIGVAVQYRGKAKIGINGWKYY